jgi:bifunctional enzyme CysN/CysC
MRRFARDANGHRPHALDAPPELLRVVTAGSVDDGKSTLIGRLLHDTRSILEDQLDAVLRTSLERGDGRLDLALLTDGLRAEREQGITIDVAYRYFATARRSFILADTPGHVRYTRNTVTGASTADVAIVLIDARHGVLEQSKRHAAIAALLRVPHGVVCVNKMDLVDWDEAAFARIAAEFGHFAARLGLPDLAAIPISALHGDNVVDRSEAAPWYHGPPLLAYLERVDVAADRRAFPRVRFPVQWVVRPHDDLHHDYRGYAGQVAAGVLRPGDEVTVLPAGTRTRIARVDTFDGPLEQASAGMSVTVLLEDDLDVSRGDMLCGPDGPPLVTRELDADVCWLDERPARPGARYVLKQTTRSTPAQLTAVSHRRDVESLDVVESPGALELNDIGRVTLRTASALAVDPYADSRATGSFILIDPATNGTVGAGMVVGGRGGGDGRPRSANVVWQRGSVTRAQRWNAIGQRGATIWLTGLPSSGKSAVAGALEARLVAEGRPAYVIDGDNLRHGLSGDLGFGAAARAENVRRAGEAARMLAEAGVVVLVALVSPYREDRDRVRARHAEDGLPFLEVWVDTPVGECERRDPKGLSRRARAGQLRGFTGVDDPYEPPGHAEMVLDGTRPLPEVVGELEGALAAQGVFAPWHSE